MSSASEPNPDHTDPSRLPHLLRHPLTAALLALLLFVLTILAARPLTEFLADQVTLKPGVVEAMGATPHFDTFKGRILQTEAFDTPGMLPMYGSSEISLLMDYHPARLLTPETGLTPFLVGMGGYQTLIHVLSLASLDNLEGDKLAIIISPQWFFPGGIQKVAYEANYSPLHLYTILNDSAALSDGLKRQILARTLQFPEAYADYPYLKKSMETKWRTIQKTEASAEAHKAPITIDPAPALNAAEAPAPPWQSFVDWLPTQMEYADLVYRDFFKLEWHIWRIPGTTLSRYATKAGLPGQNIPRRPEWDNLLREAEEKGRKAVTNNAFSIEDNFYNRNIVPKLETSKNAERSYVMTESSEYADLQLLLAVLKEKKAKPLFVILPMNGRWYDYSGILGPERDRCYDKITGIIKEAGYPLADFTDQEYATYFMSDPWHIAWTGWIEVNRVLYGYGNTGQIP